MLEGPRNFFVVGIGASAGGLQATAELLSHLPPDKSLAVVVIQHLDRDHPSELTELLGRESALPVHRAAEGTRLEGGNVYVLGENAEVELKDGVLRTTPRRPAKGVASTIDHFFRSLAEDAAHFAVGVLLSGTGSDGVAGLQAIKAAGGLCFAQDEKSAAFPGMPRAAIDAGCVDLVLPPAELAAHLVLLVKDAEKLTQELTAKREHGETEEARNLAALFRLVSARRGVDFSGYKQSTVMRRLARRMVLVRAPSLADYLRILQTNREEIDALYETLLINVTEFFRDPEYFEFLASSLLPGLISSREAEPVPFRCWVPGCATGEEAYSLAMLILEQFDARGLNCQLQVFATDVSDRALAVARTGQYAAAAVEALAPERVARFFNRHQNAYVVTKRLRDACIFARQNVATDSPFSRLDLISCRNLMIYLGPDLQRKLMPLFHYALNPGGHLMLGTSESVGAHVDLFRLVDRRFRIYSRKSASRQVNLDFAPESAQPQNVVRKKAEIHMPNPKKETFDVLREADRLVLGRHAPPGVLVNEDLEILQFRGKIMPYISPASGRASLTLAKMANQGLAAEVEAAVLQAKRDNIRVHRPNLTFEHDDKVRTVHVDVTPIEAINSKERFYLVLFVADEAEKAEPDTAQLQLPQVSGDMAETAQLRAQVEQLKQDLQATRNYLQATIEKHESTNQELRAANEEIQSSNEELQSTNEELETAKEELQSTNEELTTVNEELHSRQGELIQLNNDLHNLINSVHLPIVILDQHLRIRRFTPMAEKVLNIIPTDIGRPLTDLNLKLQVEDLPQHVLHVAETLTQYEAEVHDQKGHWYSMRLRPYKTSDSKIDGVVMTLVDIDEAKRARQAVDEARTVAKAMVDRSPEPLVAVNSRMEVRLANNEFYELFETTEADALGRSLLEVAGPLATVPDARDALAKALPEGKHLQDFAVECELPRRGRKRVQLSTAALKKPVADDPLYLVTLKLN